MQTSAAKLLIVGVHSLRLPRRFAGRIVRPSSPVSASFGVHGIAQAPVNGWRFGLQIVGGPADRVRQFQPQKATPRPEALISIRANCPRLAHSVDPALAAGSRRRPTCQSVSTRRRSRGRSVTLPCRTMKALPGCPYCPRRGASRGPISSIWLSMQIRWHRPGIHSSREQRNIHFAKSSHP
jgi:hypothetical protein